MDKVYIVTHQASNWFEIMEVFNTRESAERYLESEFISILISKYGYERVCFFIIEKILWKDDRKCLYRITS